MLQLIARRILETIPVLVLVATITFFMMKAVPGGPLDTEKNIPQEIKVQIEAFYGLDQPLWKQYASYMGNLLRGDLGPSFKHANRSVNELIAAALPVSLELGGIALCIALLIGIPFGIAAAVRQNTWIDYLASTTAMAGICLPTFVMGPLLVLVFALHFEQFNASGWDFARDRVLPALTLGLVYAGYIARLTRGGMLEVLNQDFIRTARARGPRRPAWFSGMRCAADCCPWCRFSARVSRASSRGRLSSRRSSIFRASAATSSPAFSTATPR